MKKKNRYEALAGAYHKEDDRDFLAGAFDEAEALIGRARKRKGLRTSSGFGAR